MTMENPRGSANKWERIRVWVETVIALLLGLFTVTYNFQQSESTKSNLELARAQIKSELVQAISHEDPVRRKMGLHLAQGLDKTFAAEMAAILALHDPAKTVRDQAAKELEVLSASDNKQIKYRANMALGVYRVMRELREKQMLDDLDEARRYYRGRNKSGELKAYQTYNGVFTALSGESRAVVADGVPGLAEAIDESVNEEILAKLFHVAFAEFASE